MNEISSFSKATTLEKTYGPAWIAYGHSFAVESEHDQAMAAYFTAAQLMKGCVGQADAAKWAFVITVSATGSLNRSVSR